MITLKKLCELNACPSGLRVFQHYFPKGKVSNKVFFKTLKENSDQLTKTQKVHLGWLAFFYTDLKFKERLQLIEQSNDPAYWAASYASGLTDAERKQLRSMYQ